MRAVALLALAAALVTTGVQRTQAPTGLSEKDRAGIRAFAERDSALVMSRNWDGLAAEYAVDAVRMPPNGPAIKGARPSGVRSTRCHQFANFLFV